MLDSYRDLIDELLGTPSRLRGLLADRVAVPPLARGLIVELSNRDLVVHRRVETMLREQNAYLRALPAEPSPHAPIEDVHALLQGFDAARGDLVSFLMTLTLKDWERTATHEVDGEVSVAEEVERHVEFDELCVERIGEALADA